MQILNHLKDLHQEERLTSVKERVTKEFKYGNL